ERGDISVRSNEHDGGRRNRADHQNLPRADVPGVDRLNAIHPWSDVEGGGLTEVEQDRPGVVQQREDPQRTVGGNDVDIRYVASEQRMSFAEVVTNVQARHLRGQSPASRVHGEKL